MFWWEFCIDIIFIFDIFLNFRTGYLDDRDELVLDPGKVAKNYITSWFPLDLISGIPFGVLDLGGVGALSFLRVLKSSRVLKSLRVLRFLKLTRLLKGTKILQRIDRDTLDTIEDFMADPSFRSVMRLMRITFAISYTTHLMACFWVLVGRLASMEDEENEGREQYKGNYAWRDPGGDTNWLMVQGWDHVHTTKKKYVRSIYIAAYYYCLTTMTSVGFGDITPRNDSERTFTIILEGIGGFVYAMVIASLTSVVSTMDSNQRIVSERLDAVSSYVKNRRFPRHLGRRLRRYFRHFYSQKTAIDEQVILGDLSTALRMEVSSFLVSGLMEGVPMFKALNPEIWAKILPLLRPARFERAEEVGKQNDKCTEMFIVLDGVLEGETFVSNEIIEHLDQETTQALERTAHAVASTDGAALAGESKDENLGRGIALSLRSPDSALKKKKPETSKVVFSDDGVQFVRRLASSDTVNILSVIKVWDRCMETVTAEEPVQCYAISSEPFFALFRDEEEIMGQMRERTVETGFQMIDDPEAPTEYGAPLFILSKKEATAREIAYEQKLAERQIELMRAKRTARLASMASEDGGTAESHQASL